MRVMMATHVPEGRVTSVAAPDRALSPKQSGEGGIVGKPDRIRLRGVYPARLLTDTSRLTQKGDSPSPQRKLHFERAPTGSRPAPCNPPTRTAELDLGPGDKCSCVNKKPPAYKRARRCLCQETPTTAICSGFWEIQTPMGVSRRRPTAGINLKEVNHV